LDSPEQNRIAHKLISIMFWVDPLQRDIYLKKDVLEQEVPWLKHLKTIFTCNLASNLVSLSVGKTTIGINYNAMKFDISSATDRIWFL